MHFYNKKHHTDMLWLKYQEFDHNKSTPLHTQIHLFTAVYGGLVALKKEITSLLKICTIVSHNLNVVRVSSQSKSLHKIYTLTFDPSSCPSRHLL